MRWIPSGSLKEGERQQEREGVEERRDLALFAPDLQNLHQGESKTADNSLGHAADVNGSQGQPMLMRQSDTGLDCRKAKGQAVHHSRSCGMMPKPSQLPLSLFDCLCPICREILLEPVTLPCSHTLCSPCFQMTVEKSSLCCPLCRRRVSTWARLHARTKTLVDLELWKRIQKEFPVECQRRANGQDSEDLEETYPVPQVSKPGELRQEYEQEVSKLEAERRAEEEEESKASEALIQKLLAEEEAERIRMEMKRQEQEEQLMQDELLAHKLSSDLVSSGESSCIPSEECSPNSKPFSASSSKCNIAAKKKAKHSGDIQRFLTPLPSCSSSCLWSEVENDSSRPESLENTNVNSCVQLEDDDDDDEMPVLYQVNNCVAVVSSQDAVPNQFMPALSPEISPRVDTVSPEVCCAPQRLLEVSLGRPGIGQLPLTRVPIDKMCSSRMPSSPDPFDTKETSKRKCVETSQEVHTNLCIDGKRRRTVKMPVNSGGRLAVQRLVELEKDMFEKWQQEEQDRLLALQMQKELDKEMSQVNRKKGSPDGYMLRHRVASSAAEHEADIPKMETIHSVKKQPKKPMSQIEDGPLKPRCDSPDENKKPYSQSRPASPANVSLHRKNRSSSMSPLLDGGKVLQSSNKQPTIMEMFQRSVLK